RELLVERALALRQLDLRGEQLGQLLVAPGLLEERGEEERRLLVALILVEHGAEVLGRLGHRVELVDADPGGFEAEAGPLLGLLREVDEAREQREQLLVLLD